MKKHIINSKKGFTIIEVVLVLAIAGLIFLMVFVALPNLQRSQRDTQRRTDYSALASNIEGYISSNGGRLPEADASLSSNLYINETGTDPNGEYYIIEVIEMASGDEWVETNSPNRQVGATDKTAYLQTNTQDDADDLSPSGIFQVGVPPEGTEGVRDGTFVYIIRHADCSGTSDTDASSIPHYNSASRKFAIFGDLEAGTYCEAH